MGEFPRLYWKSLIWFLLPAGSRCQPKGPRKKNHPKARERDNERVVSFVLPLIRLSA